MANTAAETKQETKADRAVAMKLENPDISNKEIAKAVGMADAYVSQMLSKARESGILPAKAKRGHTPKTKTALNNAPTRKQVAAKRATTSAAKVAVTRGAGTSPTTAAPESVGEVLAARSQIACLVQRMGACAVKTLVADVTGE